MKTTIKFLTTIAGIALFAHLALIGNDPPRTRFQRTQNVIQYDADKIEYDPDCGYRLKPGSHYTFENSEFRHHVQIGEDGLRESTSGTGSVLLGDSFAFGWGVDDFRTAAWVEVDGEKRSRVYTCHLAKVWQELGVPELGRIYCYVDQAKYEAYNPELQCVHVKNVLDGDAYCELAVRPKKGKGQRA